MSRWDNYVTTLRQKWHEVPVGKGVMSTTSLLRMKDRELVKFWDRKLMNQDFLARGWYRLYGPVLKGKDVLDVGCGFGMDSLTFAGMGANVTSLDIVEPNVKLVERVARLKATSLKPFYLEKLSSLDSLGQFDVIWAMGSLHTAPFQVMKEEASALLSHLKVGGRWIQLAYPKERWIREGRRSFEEWGRKTDSGAPHIEWYDLDKISSLLAPAKFRPLLFFNFHNEDFNWFDLERLD